MHALRAEVSRLQETIKTCLRKTTLPVSARVPPGAGEDHTHLRTATPTSRSVTLCDRKSSARRAAALLHPVSSSLWFRPAERQRAASRGRPARPAELPVRMRAASSQRQKQQEPDGRKLPRGHLSNFCVNLKNFICKFKTTLDVAGRVDELVARSII